jgi:hypothetical protein
VSRNVLNTNVAIVAMLARLDLQFHSVMKGWSQGLEMVDSVVEGGGECVRRGNVLG